MNKFFAFLALLSPFLISCPSLAAGESPALVRAPLRFQEAENLATDGNMIRLFREYRQIAGNPIIFEAEEATVIELLDSGKRIVFDPGVSGGYCLEHVRRLEFQFDAVTPGRYRVWLRAWFPLKADYNHSERMNDGETRFAPDTHPSDEPKVWRWVEGLEYTLEKGMNRHVFPAPTAFCGGARLDKVLLLPAGHAVPSGLGPAASPVIGAQNGQAITRRINMERVNAWRLNFDVTENRGKAEVAYSYDKIAWQSVTPGQIMTVPEPKPGYLYFKFGIEGVAGSPSPWIQGLAFYVELEKKP